VRVATSNAESARGTSLLPFAEIALAGVMLATVATMWRLFDDGDYLVPLGLHAVAAHAVVALLRRRGTSLAASAAVTAVVAVLALCWGHLWSTTWLGLPTGDTLSAAADELELAWRTFGEVRAPAPVLTGFLLSAALAIWIGAWLADLAAFRQWTPFEALIPAGTLFVFTSLFAADRARVLAAVVWLTAAMAFVLLHRAARQQTSPSWLGSDARVGTQAIVRTGAVLVVGAVGLAWVFGPRLPGAEADALVPFAPQDREGSRQTISPLVEMRGRLVEQSQVELLTVTSPRRDYWRLTSLDIFDGDVWSSRGSFGDADGELDGSGNREVPSEPVTQTFTILALDTIWLPAAFEAAELTMEGQDDVRWDDVSSTLIVSQDLESSDGLDYSVVSDIADFDPEVLAAVGGDEVPGDIRDRNLDLPDDFPGRVTQLARDVVGGATTPYAQARALQDHFTESGQYTYSLDAPPGHSSSAIEDFLFVTRTGYCEQFAGAYAAMARSIGLPARVAVGFTTGQPDPSDPNRYVVRGENAHAWPEVYIDGAGWVSFDPTPGRGQPGTEDYTGRPDRQDAPGVSNEAVGPPAGETPNEEPTPTTEPGGPTTTAPPLDDVGEEPEAVGPVSTPRRDATSAVLRVLAVVGGVALAAVLVGLAVALTRRVRRWRRRRAATTPEALVGVCAQEVAEDVAVLGLVQRRHESDAEWARRLSGELADPRPLVLGQLLTRASFDPVGISEEEAAEAPEVVATVREGVHRRSSRWQRLLAAMDPRPPERQALARARARSTAPRPSGPRITIQSAPSG
jgi:transglutaminase-like putative cysteine protease